VEQGLSVWASVAVDLGHGGAVLVDVQRGNERGSFGDSSQTGLAGEPVVERLAARLVSGHRTSSVGQS
jgi:hypothetical protein